MREVDEALATAYAQREKGEPARGVPPAPHWPAHALARAPEQDAPLVPADSSAPALAFGIEAPSGGPAAELQWPAVVLGLERDWGDRFDRLAERLIEGRRRQNLRVILFTSCHRAEGRTTLVLTLARALARHPCRTVLVRRRPHRADARATAGPPPRGGPGRRGRRGTRPVRRPDRRPRRPPDRLADALGRRPAPRLPGLARPGRAPSAGSAASST